MARHREVEQKFDLDPGADVPDLSSVGAGVAVVGDPVVTALEATYYDTAGLALARRGVTLRRRTGGDDAGWHLKLRLAGDGPQERVEVRHPPGPAGNDGAVPAGLVAQVRALVRDHPLAPVAVLRTTRVQRHLLAADGTALAVVADDVVCAERLPPGTAPRTTWRELEIELVDGDRKVLRAAAEHLRRQGIAPSGSSSKLARALGRPTTGHPETAAGSAGAACTAYLQMHVDQLLAADPAARAAQPDGVHRMRVATRRLRSALATCRPLLDRSETDPVRLELRWLGEQLGAVRDVQVQRDRLRARLARQPPDLVLGPVRRRIDLELRRRERVALRRLRAALEGARYFRLLDAMDDLLARPPFTDLADDPAGQVVPRLVGRSVRRVRRAAAAIEGVPPGHRAERLHEVRKAAKRARYAAEAASGVAGRPARRLRRRMAAVQEALGQHQDSVTAQVLLRELAVAAHGAGENGFTFGVLLAEEAACARAARRGYPRQLRRALSRKTTRWAH